MHTNHCLHFSILFSSSYADADHIDSPYIYLYTYVILFLNLYMFFVFSSSPSFPLFFLFIFRCFSSLFFFFFPSWLENETRWRNARVCVRGFGRSVAIVIIIRICGGEAGIDVADVVHVVVHPSFIVLISFQMFRHVILQMRLIELLLMLLLMWGWCWW